MPLLQMRRQNAVRIVTGRTAPILLIVSLALASVLSACSGAHVGKNSGGVQHVVLCWLKDPGNEESRQALIEAGYEFKSIPGVVSVAAGRALPSERDVVDDSFDVGFVIVFENIDALKNYSTHPMHLKAVSELLGPLAANVQIYDIIE